MLVVEGDGMLQLQSALGILVLLAFAWAISERRRDVCWRTAAIGLAHQDCVASKEAILSVREKAVSGGHSRLAADCLAALAIIMPAADWIEAYADLLLAEAPTPTSHMTRAVALAEVGRREDAWNDYVSALRLEGPDGDREIHSLCVAGLRKLSGAD